MKLKPEMLWIAGTANASSRNVFAAVIVLIAVVLIIGILLRIRKSLARKAQPPVTEKTAEPAPSYPYVVRPLVSFQTSEVTENGRSKNYHRWVKDLRSANPKPEEYEGMNDEMIRAAGYLHEDEPAWELNLSGTGDIELLPENEAKAIRVRHIRYGDLGFVPDRKLQKVQ